MASLHRDIDTFFNTGPLQSPPPTPQSPNLSRQAASLASEHYHRSNLRRRHQAGPPVIPSSESQPHQFYQIRPQIFDASSRASTPASAVSMTSPPASTCSSHHVDEYIDMENNEDNTVVYGKYQSDANADDTSDDYNESDVDNDGIVIEEVDESEIRILQGVEVLRPSTYEDAESDMEGARPARWSARQEELENETGIINGLRNLGHGTDAFVLSPDRDRRHERLRNNRWSGASLMKRTHSQSIGSDSDDYDDFDDMDPNEQDLPTSARRLRRRVKGPGDRGSLLCEDTRAQSAMREVDEPVEEGLSSPSAWTAAAGTKFDHEARHEHTAFMDMEGRYPDFI